MKQKKKYVAPELTVVQFHAERGYAASNAIFSHAQQLDALLQNEIDRANAEGAIGNDFAAGYFDNVDETQPTGEWTFYGTGANGQWF